MIENSRFCPRDKFVARAFARAKIIGAPTFEISFCGAATNYGAAGGVGDSNNSHETCRDSLRIDTCRQEKRCSSCLRRRRQEQSSVWLVLNY